MDQNQTPEGVRFYGPSVYRIVVKGVLGKDWDGGPAGLSLHTVNRESPIPRTTLIGWIKDQTELNRLLGTLYELHLPILAVEKIEDSH